MRNTAIPFKSPWTLHSFYQGIKPYPIPGTGYTLVKCHFIYRVSADGSNNGPIAFALYVLCIGSLVDTMSESVCNEIIIVY